MHRIQILILLLITIIPGLIVLGGKVKSGKWIKPLLSLSGAFLLALSFCHLLPEAYEHNGASVGIYVLVGFFLQVLLESLTKGVEHGHYHSHGHFSKYFPLLAILGLTVHSVMETLPLGSHNHLNEQQYLLGIALHKFPIALTLASILKSTPLKNTGRWLWFLIFGLSAPLVLILFEMDLVPSVSEELLFSFSGLAVGIFLHVSTTILFEVEDGHRLNPNKLIAILSGLAIYFLFV